MARLRRSDCSAPGIRRRRRGRGFSYTHANGSSVADAKTLERIRELAIPPAWSDVWICPWPNGHIQAVGTDAAGRRQYRYHDQWRRERDREKFDRTVDFAAMLPILRARVERDLAQDGLGRTRVLAAIVRLLDIGLFRVGGEEYADEHETFGVASLRKEHVRMQADVMVFTYHAKGDIERVVEVRDEPARRVVASLRRRRTGGPRLFAYKQGRRWLEIHAPDVNEYLKDVMGGQFSAKDFRTWSGTVLAAAALAEGEPAPDERGRRRAVTEAVGKVAEHLGNTPAVSRSAYIDPRVIERFEDGETIGAILERPPSLDTLDSQLKHGGRRYRAVEEAVMELVEEADSAADPVPRTGP
jgi:DNA topoisomerase I